MQHALRVASFFPPPPARDTLMEALLRVLQSTARLLHRKIEGRRMRSGGGLFLNVFTRWGPAGLQTVITEISLLFAV